MLVLSAGVGTPTEQSRLQDRRRDASESVASMRSLTGRTNEPQRAKATRAGHNMQLARPICCAGAPLAVREALRRISIALYHACHVYDVRAGHGFLRVLVQV